MNVNYMEEVIGSEFFTWTPAECEAAQVLATKFDALEQPKAA